MRQRCRSLLRALSVMVVVCVGLASCGTPDATISRSLGTPVAGQAIEMAAFSPGGSLLATANPDASITVWDMASGQRRFTLAGHSGKVTALVFSPDGKSLASGATDKRVELWDVASGKELRALSGHAGGVSAVSFSPDGKTLASGGTDGAVKQWEVSSGKAMQSLSAGVGGGVTSLAYSPDGKSLASGGGDAKVQLWNPASGQLTRSFTGHKDAVGTLAFSPDGQSLATGSNDNQVKVWSVQDGKEQRTLSGHTGGVLAVSFSPDGKSLASGSVDKTARLWDATNGQAKQTLSGHTAAVPAVAFSPDAKSLATGGRDNSAKQWDATTGKLQKSINVSPAASGPIDGLWDSNYGPVTLITQPASGGTFSVTGYWYQNGDPATCDPNACRGAINSGTYNPATGQLDIKYHQPWNNTDGTATFKLTGADLVGSFVQPNGSGAWNLTRPKASPGASASVTTTGSNLVSFGGFECPLITSSYQAFPAGQNLCGWAVKEQSIDLVGSLWPAAEGKQSVDLTGSPGMGVIEQYLSTVPGQAYRIRFALAGNPDSGPTTRQVATEWGDRQVGTETFDMTGHSNSAMGWVYKEYIVTASDSSTRLAFRSLTDGSFGPVIDDVSVFAVKSAVVGPVAGVNGAPLVAHLDGSGSASDAASVAVVALPTDRRRSMLRPIVGIG